MKFSALAFETVGAASCALRALACALETGLDWQVEHDSEIGRHVVGSESVQLAEQFEIEAAPVALVGSGRIRIAIRDNNLSSLKSGPELFAHVLRTIGEHQQQFGGYIQRDGGIEENRANGFTGARTARLMRDRYAPAVFAQRVAKDRGLRCLAASFDAFERDENSSRHNS